MIKDAGINSCNASEIQKKHHFTENISKETQEAVNKKNNKKECICTMISGKILKKYRLLRYAANNTNTERRKLSKANGKAMNPIKPKKGFQSVLHKKVLDFYHRDDISTALPGKRDPKKVKRKRKLVLKRVFNDYLLNLYQKFISENIETPCPFLTFTSMRPNNFALANFANRKTYLCNINSRKHKWKKFYF